MTKKKKTMFDYTIEDSCGKSNFEEENIEPVSIKETVDGAKKLIKGFFPTQQEKTEQKQKQVEKLEKDITALQTERKLNQEINRLKQQLKEEKTK